MCQSNWHSPPLSRAKLLTFIWNCGWGGGGESLKLHLHMWSHFRGCVREPWVHCWIKMQGFPFLLHTLEVPSLQMGFAEKNGQNFFLKAFKKERGRWEFDEWQVHRQYSAKKWQSSSCPTRSHLRVDMTMITNHPTPPNQATVPSPLKHLSHYTCW